jgi:acetyltransferase-like isoleucine patch superfamily enzyme
MCYGFRDAKGKRIQGTRISSHAFIDPPEHLELGEMVYIGRFNVLEASHGITIEEGTQITTHCVITSHSSHHAMRLYGPSHAGKEMIGYVKGAIHIGKYSFIGPHCTLMPGTKLGKGTLVQAYSYLKGEFPDYSIIGGNPAKIIGDTREVDQKFRIQHPELKPNYEFWTSK